MLTLLRMVYPEIPPSSNKLFFRGTILTKVARAYAERFAAFAVRNHGHEIAQMDPKSLYWLHLIFYFETVENKDWDHPDPKKRPKSGRWKKFDLTNRIKLLEDCVRDAIDIDDSQTFRASQEKHCDPLNPRVEIVVQTVRPQEFGLKEGP